jgi:hypothetical protein
MLMNFVFQQFCNLYKYEPAIHLDNRYRLMAGLPMLDADGNETTEIGIDNTASVWDLETMTISKNGDLTE